MLTLFFPMYTKWIVSVHLKAIEETPTKKTRKLVFFLRQNTNSKYQAIITNYQTKFLDQHHEYENQIIVNSSKNYIRKRPTIKHWTMIKKYMLKTSQSIVVLHRYSSTIKTEMNIEW